MMMELIPEEAVDRIWKEVARFTPDQINREMAKLGKNQRDLLGFVLELTKDSDASVTHLAVYMVFTVFRMFQKSYNKKIKPISSTKIIKCSEANENLMERLEGAHEKFLDRIIRIQIAGQPYVMKYVVDALVEAYEDEDLRGLTEEDKGFLFLLLKTVIDLLNKATEK